MACHENKVWDGKSRKPPPAEKMHCSTCCNPPPQPTFSSPDGNTDSSIPNSLLLSVITGCLCDVSSQTDFSLSPTLSYFNVSITAYSTSSLSLPTWDNTAGNNVSWIWLITCLMVQHRHKETDEAKILPKYVTASFSFSGAIYLSKCSQFAQLGHSDLEFSLQLQRSTINLV